MKVLLLFFASNLISSASFAEEICGVVTSVSPTLTGGTISTGKMLNLDVPNTSRSGVSVFLGQRSHDASTTNYEMSVSMAIASMTSKILFCCDFDATIHMSGPRCSASAALKAL